MAEDEQGYGLGFNYCYNNTTPTPIQQCYQQYQTHQHPYQSYDFPPPPAPAPPPPPPPPPPPLHLRSIPPPIFERPPPIPPPIPPPKPPSIPPPNISDATQAIQNAQSISQRIQSSSAEESSKALKTLLEKDRRRVHLALLKNFEYLAKKDEEAYRVQLMQLQQMDEEGGSVCSKKGPGGDSEDWMKMAAMGRKEKKAKCMGGIGSDTRKKQQRWDKNRTGGSVSGGGSGGSIYVCGFCVGEKDAIEMDQEIHQLFESYGKIQRVKLYRQRATNELKGDALVVYQDSEVDIDTVCSQLNGAELPCGSIITVERANFNLKKNVDSEQDSNETKKGESKPTESTSESINKKDENGADTARKEDGSSDPTHTSNGGEKKTEEVTDDLDDFFASLE